MKKETALFLGISLALAFLTGIFAGLYLHFTTLVPYLLFAAIILLATGLILFGSQR